MLKNNNVKAPLNNITNIINGLTDCITRITAMWKENRPPLLSAPTGDLVMLSGDDSVIVQNITTAIAALVSMSNAAKPKLCVWFNSVPESNGKQNWTVRLYRKKDGDIDTFSNCETIYRGESFHEARYCAYRLRHLIGELPSSPDILEYDPDLTQPGPVYLEKPVAQLDGDLKGGTSDTFLTDQVFESKTKLYLEPGLTHKAPVSPEQACLEPIVTMLVDSLEKLAKLGNGDHYGNSTGNAIAQHALKLYSEMIIKTKPEKPVEQFCFCNEEFSLQSVSGGAAPEGMFGRITLKYNGQYVHYVKDFKSEK